ARRGDRVPPRRDGSDGSGRSRRQDAEEGEGPELVRQGRDGEGLAPTTGRRTEETRVSRRPQTQGTAVRAVGLAVVLGTACGGLAAASVSATAPVPVTAEASTTAEATTTSATAQIAAARTASPTTASAEVRILAGDDGTTVLERVDTYVTHREEDPLYSDEGAEMLYGDAYEDLRELQETASVPTYLVFDSGLDYSTTSTVAQILAETL